MNPIEKVCSRLRHAPELKNAGRLRDGINVERLEQTVLEGCRGVLTEGARRPRAIFLGMHPFNWHLTGTTSASTLGMLADRRYQTCLLAVAPLAAITEYGEIMAIPLPLA